MGPVVGHGQQGQPLPRGAAAGLVAGKIVGVGVADKAAGRNDPNYVGGFGGVLATSPSDASAAEMAPGDLELGRRYGERVAAMAQRLRG